MEQKNWTHVRQLVGYLRFDTEAELQVLNQIWALDQRFTNYLLTQQKLVSKTREGAKVTKRYDRASTPYERTLGWSGLAEGDRRRLRATRAKLRPAELSRRIEELTTRLEHLALSKAPAPLRPPVNRAFNSRPDPEIPREATNQPWRRF